MSEVVLYKTAGAPSIGKPVLDAIKRTDPSIRLAFYHWAINPKTRRPLYTDKGRLERFPRWYVFVEEYGQPVFQFVVETPEGDFQGIDFRFLDMLNKSRWLRNQNAKKYLAQRDVNMSDIQEAQRRAAAQRAEDFVAANRRKFREALENPTERISLTRDAKSFSYSGQSRREAGWVEKSGKELGWEH